MNLRIISSLCFAVIIICAQGQKRNTDCLVRSSKRYDTSESGSYQPLIAHLSESHGLTIDLYYHDMDEDFYTDRLSLSLTNGDKIYSTRNGKMDTTNLNSSFVEPGWAYMNVSLNNNSVVVNTASYHVTFAGTLSAYTIGAKLFTDCHKSTPTWKIRKNISSTIPLDGLENIYFSLSCKKSFTPIVRIPAVGVLNISNANSSLPNGTYDFLIKKEPEKIILYSKQMENGYEDILEMRMVDDLINMEISSLDESFLFELNPKKIEDIRTTDPTSPEDSSSWGGVIAAILSTFIILGVVVAVLLLLKKKGYFPPKSRTNSSSSEKADKAEAKVLIDNYQNMREYYLKAYKDAMESAAPEDGKLTNQDELNKCHQEAVNEALKQTEENYNVKTKDKELLKQASDAVFKDVKAGHQKKMITKATSDGLKEYIDIMSEVLKENLPLLCDKDLQIKHTGAMDNAKKKIFESMNFSPDIYASAEQQFTQRLEDKYDQYKKQEEERKTKALSEYKKAEEEAKKVYSSNFDKLVINGKNKSDWDTLQESCLNFATETFSDKSIAACIALPDQKEEILKRLTEELKVIGKDKISNQNEIHCKDACIEARKNVLAEYNKNMESKFSLKMGFIPRQKDLLTHHNLKSDIAIKEYINITSIYTDNHKKTVEECKTLLEKDLEDAYKNHEKNEGELEKQDAQNPNLLQHP